MSTRTTDQQLKTLANRIRSYVDGNGDSVNTYSVKVYPGLPAPDAALPNVVLSKTASISDPEFHHLRETFTVEVIIQGRARKDEATVNAVADLVQSAFPMWSDATSGLMYFQGLQRGDVQYTNNLQEEEIIELRLALELAAWPVLATALT